MDQPVQTVTVQLQERTYEIQIGRGLLGRSGPFLADHCPAAHVVIITDDVVRPLYVDPIADGLRRAGSRADVLTVPAGESSKSVDVAFELWNELLRLGTDRQSVVVAVGGGVVGDLAGFVAATFARGLAFVQVPTTLLAQVDSSVGGKVGVNLPEAKNLVGSFWQPRGVLIDTDVLHTLANRQYRAGLAEVVKYGVILDADFFAYLEAHVAGLAGRDPDVLTHVVARCCRLKADVVEQDETERTGVRAVLNYGHTFCHALEAAGSYSQLLHGEAVAIGMLCASRLAERLGHVDRELTRRQLDLLRALALPTQVPDVDHGQLLRLMRHDKKTTSGELRFVLPTEMGHVELVDGVDDGDVLAALAEAPEDARR